MKTNLSPITAATRFGVNVSAASLARRAAVSFCRVLALLALLLLSLLPVHAQWQTQSFNLQPGWNAVFLHVDASHTNLDGLIGGDPANPITEVWLWQPPASTLQFTTTPQQPSTPNSQWSVWDRSLAVADTLTRLGGNAAYLVRNTNSIPYTWTIVGRTVPPRYQWTTTGLNFLGFPTPASTPPNFDTFLLPAPDLQNTAEIYRYPGGNLGSNNPVRVFSPMFRNTTVNRGEAFWIRSGTTYNRYYGPVEIQLQDSAGVNFSDSLGTYRIRLKNLSSSPRTMTLSLLASAAVPVGQPAITATPPLLVRGALNTTNLTYSHTVLASPTNFTLTAQGQIGSELEIVLGLNRSAMPGARGSLYAGILRLADTGGLSQFDAPVTATVADSAGLWVGDANVTSVGHYLKTYARIGDVTNLSTIKMPPVFNWTPRDVNRAWVSVASSADGTKLAAVENTWPSQLMFTSTNSGTTWQEKTSSQNWLSCVALSADGNKLLAASDGFATGGYIGVSLDFGATWTNRLTDAFRSWRAIASSADGGKLVAVDRGLAAPGGQIFTSVDGGGNWTQRQAARVWMGVASSTDGNKLVAVANGDQIYTSTDSGTNWTARESSRAWSSVASSTDGSRLVAAVNGGQLFTSTNSGASWVARESSRAWTSVASSADGNWLAAVVDGGQIYTSTDAGGTWAASESSRRWRSIASSAVGNKLVGVANNDRIFTGLSAYELQTNSGRLLLPGANGAPYVATATNTSLGSVARQFPLRLILHNNGLGNGSNTNLNLLQRVFFGRRFGTNLVVTTRESLLDTATIGSARRVSAGHLPFSLTNTPIAKTSGTFGLGNSVVFNVPLDYRDQASNPFLHTFHPDHDNLTADFKRVEVQGAESYTINRQITLTFNTPAGDFASLTSGTRTLGGTYSELITFNGLNGSTRQFSVQGSFTLNRISSIATLTTN